MYNIAASDKEDSIQALIKKCVVSSRRNGLWFKLSREQRSLLSLSLSLNIKFKSFALLRALVSVIKYLKELGQGIYNYFIRGMQLAWIFSSVAYSWGNKSSLDWRNDKNYIVYLGLCFS